MLKPQPRPSRRFVSLHEAAELAGVSTKTMRRRIADGTIAAYKLGPRLTRVDLNDLEAAFRPIPTAGPAE